ncbi:6000_t:CDS:2, partial [Acaulospora colombiana]
DPALKEIPTPFRTSKYVSRISTSIPGEDFGAVPKETSGYRSLAAYGVSVGAMTSPKRNPSRPWSHRRGEYDGEHKGQSPPFLLLHELKWPESWCNLMASGTWSLGLWIINNRSLEKTSCALELCLLSEIATNTELRGYVTRVHGGHLYKTLDAEDGSSSQVRQICIQSSWTGA